MYKLQVMYLCNLESEIQEEHILTDHTDQSLYHMIHFYTGHIFLNSFYHKNQHHILGWVEKR